MESEVFLAAWLLTATAVVLYLVQRVLDGWLELARANLEVEKRREIRDRVMADNYYNCRKENEILHALLDQRSASDVRGR
jgi:hypothetical protein